MLGGNASDVWVCFSHWETVLLFFPPPIHPFFFLYIIMPMTFKWAIQIADHLGFLQNYQQPTALTHEMFTKMLMFWSLHSFPVSPFSQRQINLLMVLASHYCTVWPNKMRQFYEKVTLLWFCVGPYVQIWFIVMDLWSLLCYNTLWW